MKVDFDSIFGAKVFNDSVMKERLSNNAYESIRVARDEAQIGIHLMRMKLRKLSKFGPWNKVRHISCTGIHR